MKKGHRMFKGRSYKNFDKQAYLASVEECDWDYFNQCEDPSEAWDVFENMLKRMLDVVCPVKSFKVKDKPDPWFTNYLIERINDKNNLLRAARRSTSIVDWHHARLLKTL